MVTNIIDWHRVGRGELDNPRMNHPWDGEVWLTTMQVGLEGRNTVFYRNNAEGLGSGPLRDALCLLEATRLKGMTP